MSWKLKIGSIHFQVFSGWFSNLSAGWTAAAFVSLKDLPTLTAAVIGAILSLILSIKLLERSQKNDNN